MVGLGFLVGAAVSKAQSPNPGTQTYADCTITYSLFGSGNVVIAPVNVSCNSNHTIRVAAHISASGGGQYSANNSGFSNNVGVAAQGDTTATCTSTDPAKPCTFGGNGASASWQVNIDNGAFLSGYNLNL